MSTATLSGITGARTNAKAKVHSFRSWLKSVPSLVIIGTILFLVLTVGSGLLFWGSNFASHMVHNQLTEQKISFPAKGTKALDPRSSPDCSATPARPSTPGRRPRRTPTGSSPCT